MSVLNSYSSGIAVAIAANVIRQTNMRDLCEAWYQNEKEKFSMKKIYAKVEYYLL